MRLEYQLSVDNGFDIDLVTSVKQRDKRPGWFNDTSVFYFGLKTSKEFVEKAWDYLFDDRVGTVKTVRACPGLNSFFSQSIPLKFPCQLLVETFEDGAYRWRASETDFIGVFHHSAEQAPKLAENYIILKFGYPIYFRPTEDVQVSITDPILFNPMPFRPSPGIVHIKKNEINTLNIIVFFEKKNARYVFNPGEVLACMQFSCIIKGMDKKDLGEDFKRYRPSGITNSRII